MSKMQDDQRQVARYNLRKLKDAKKYPSINKLLTKPLRATLTDLLEFAAEHDPLIDTWRVLPVYMLSTDKLTHDIRRKKSQVSGRTTNRHMNMLCAMRLVEKIPQSSKDFKRLIKPNKEFVEASKVAHPVNVFTIPRWTSDHLKAAELEAERLLRASITAASISDIALRAAGLLDISDRVYPNNNKEAVDRQRPDFEAITDLISRFITDTGYCSRQNLIDNLDMTEDKLKRLLSNFRGELQTLYNYHRPTKEERIRFNLPDGKYIYTPRSGREKES